MPLSVASSSSSSSQAPATHRYDVFISFRGEDTRNGFLSHLQAALRENQIETFRDDDGMEKGGAIWDELVDAIRNSKLFVVIFSKNYASSRWCLRELVEILKCKNNNNVIPVFYGIEPTHVRKQTGSYRTAFDEHERSWEDRCHVQQWRTALTHAANLSGIPFDHHRDDETRLISEIIKSILPHWLNNKCCIDGLQRPFICNTNYTNVQSLMRRKLKEVLVIGIWGMGGIGKSTIAEALFNNYSPKYEASCFLSNSRELGNPCLNDICNRLLSQLLNQDLHITNIRVLDSRIVDKLKQKRAFIVLDDVVDAPIATDLVPCLRTCLCPGSLVILTTRDQSVLTGGGVKRIHEIKQMSNGDSHKLFSHYAFSDSHPKQEYNELAARVIDYANGIPLALKILGSFLRGKSVDEWDSALKKLRKYPNKNIQQVLRLSYDRLDDEERNILLDIACCLGKIKEDSPTTILNKCFDNHADIGIKNLLDKALISIDLYGQFRTHGLIQEMCENIVREESRKNGGQQTRLWDTKEVNNILQNERGIEVIESIELNMDEISVDPRVIMYKLGKMSKLRLLMLRDNIHRDPAINLKLPDSLRLMFWQRCPQKSISLKCWPRKLVEIFICDSNIQKLWDGVQILPDLETVDLSNCRYLIECPNLAGCRNLKCIDFDGCESLPYIDPSIFSLPKIEELDVSNCKALKRLCSACCSPSLRRLHASGCSNLEEFSVSMAYDDQHINNSFDKHHGTLTFDISYSLEKIPKNFAKRIMLMDPQKQEDDTCIILKRIFPTPAFLSLKGLYFYHCKSLSKLPDNIDVLQSLEELAVHQCSIVSLPESIKNLQQLQRLLVTYCEKLQYVPSIPASIVLFEATECESLMTVPTVIITSETSFLFKVPLVMLRFHNCTKLDKHAYEDVLIDLKTRIEHAASKGCGHIMISYYLPIKESILDDWFPADYYSTHPSVTVEVPTYRNIYGLAFYILLPQYQSCNLEQRIIAVLRCECYLENSPNERIAYSKTYHVLTFNSDFSPLKMKSDHMVLWHHPFCCDDIMKAIKERKRGTNCNPILKFDFYARTKGHEELVIKGCGIHWMHEDVRESDLESQSNLELAVLEKCFRSCRWVKPKSGWMKINVKGSIDPWNSRGGCGGVIRDEYGSWIRGFTAPIVVTDDNSVYFAELVAIKKGLELAWSMQVPRIICESDCFIVYILCCKCTSAILQMNNRPSILGDVWPVLDDIRELMQRNWDVSYVHVRRLQNLEADTLATKAVNGHASGALLWNLPPPELPKITKGEWMPQAVFSEILKRRLQRLLLSSSNPMAASTSSWNSSSPNLETIGTSSDSESQFHSWNTSSPNLETIGTSSDFESQSNLETHENRGLEIFDVNFNDDAMEAMSGVELVANVSPICAADDVGLGQKLMESQSKIDMLEVHQDVIPKIESKSRCFNVVYVFMVFAVLVLAMAVAIVAL